MEFHRGRLIDHAHLRVADVGDFLVVADIVFQPAIGVCDRLPEMFLNNIDSLSVSIVDCRHHDCRLRAGGGEMGILITKAFNSTI
jgi:hypothetical protein